MKAKKYQPLLDIKTFNSQQSDIDIFSRLQGNFLEKFFRYNLSDYFGDITSNIYEDILDKKLYSKSSKLFASHLFIVKNAFIVQQFQQKVQNFYKNRSKSVEAGQLPYAFRLRYCNRNPMPNLIRQNQLIFMEVKIKAEVSKIQQLPNIIIKQIQAYHKSQENNKFQQSSFNKILSNYSQQYFNIFLCYFGDINFHIFNKQYYQTKQIKILNKKHKLRIFVFFISRKAMVQTFKTINKISSLQYINDLVIQFYEMKRQKNKNKKIKKDVVKHDKKQMLQMRMLQIFGVLGLVGVGLCIVKFVI